VNDTSISNEQASRKFDRNKREKNTREAYRENTPVSDLEYMAEKGHPTEVSGAAIARIKANKPGKFES
jgi:hypothetical protein